MNIRFTLLLFLFPFMALAQDAYFADGYHGGVYGHYPRWKTRFIIDKLKEHPDWKINLEIEPETWDSVMVYDPQTYADFQKVMADPQFAKRIDVVNPAYGQAYFFNISGESVIRQFDLGIRKTRQHFPSFKYASYSAEEPCFTSSLPQVLLSFGFKNAVLKNPNTCWGGYTRALGGELISWRGPDGTIIKTVPRYESEALEENSTWQTTAWDNSVKYINASLQQGIEHPVGMCLQDAGWKGGPLLGMVNPPYHPSRYVTWTEYFDDIAIPEAKQEWDLSQEDIQVSLVWGAQVLQRLAQQVRVSEGKITTAEKVAAYSKAFNNTQWPSSSFDEAWRTLLLSQHHDCWIVPYNGRKGDTWADKAVYWTNITNSISDSVIYKVLGAERSVNSDEKVFINVFNSQAQQRKDFVKVDLPNGWDSGVELKDENGEPVSSQKITSIKGKAQLVFVATARPLGINSFELNKSDKKPKASQMIKTTGKGLYLIETDQYKITLDPAKGGVFTSLISKKLNSKEFVDSQSQRSFNELRGFFYEQNAFLSSMDKPARIEILDNGPLMAKVKVSGFIGEHPFTQLITLYHGERKIDFEVNIDWKGSPGIGKYSQMETYEPKDPEKAFYNDEYKLLVHFPLNLQNQQVYKNAPFDVTKSTLTSTFFDRWDSIKNNVILNWVDILDEKSFVGMALFADHTTSYAHSQDHPLALNIQFSGRALWGNNYRLEGPTQVKYALVPHAQKWDNAGIWMESVNWNEPLIAVASAKAPDIKHQSLLELENKGWELTSLQFDNDDLLVRVFNAEGNENPQNIILDNRYDKVQLEELNGRIIRTLELKAKGNEKSVSLAIPRFGIRTLRVKPSKR